MTLILVVVTLIASLVICLVLVGRSNLAVVLRDWEMILTPEGTRLLDGAENSFRAELHLVDLAFAQARAQRDEGHLEEARRLLDLGYRVTYRLTPDILHLVGGMTVFSRMLGAMAPLPPLRPRDFRLPKVIRLAYLDVALHHLLVSTAERFRFRLFCLRHAFGAALAYLARSTSDADWRRVRQVREDVETLTHETLESLKVVLISVAATPRWDAVETVQSR